MELHGEVGIAAPRARVWAALNDPETLARCIDGVESLARVPDAAGGERFAGRMNARVGPVRASFAGHVTLTQVEAPARYVLVGEGKGGVAGFAKGEAVVTLTETAAEATLLTYHVTSSVGGKLAQLGARLIEGTAKGYATSFFTRLKDELEAEVPPAGDAEVVTTAAPAVADAEAVSAAPAVPAAPAPAPAPAPAGGLSPLVWGAALIVAVLAFLAWQWN